MLETVIQVPACSFSTSSAHSTFRATGAKNTHKGLKDQVNTVKQKKKSTNLTWTLPDFTSSLSKSSNNVIYRKNARRHRAKREEELKQIRKDRKNNNDVTQKIFILLQKFNKCP